MLAMEHHAEMVIPHGFPNFYQPSIRTSWQQQPRRNLPTVPTLPSTPGISRPGSAAGQIPMKPTQDSITEDLWEPATPPLSAASPWGNSMMSTHEHSEPSTPGAIAMPVLLSPPTEQTCTPVDYFSTQPTYHPVQTNSPSTPVFGEPGCINPALISFDDFTQPTPPVFSGVPATSVPVTVETVSAPVPSPISTCVSTPVTANPAELTLAGTSLPIEFETHPFELSGLGIKRPSSSGSDGTGFESEESPRKRIKKEAKPKKISPSPIMSSPAPSSPMMNPESPANDNSQSQPATPMQPSEIEQGLAEGTVIQGPPPQNRRGRKQSFTKDPSKPFGCLICDRWFRRQEHLKRHHKSLHTNDRPHTCNECGKKFSRSDNLTQHQRTHGSGSVALEIMPQSMQQMQGQEHMQVQGQMVNTHSQGGVPPYEHLAQVMFTVFSEIGGSDNELEGESPTDNQGVPHL